MNPNKVVIWRLTIILVFTPDFINNFNLINFWLYKLKILTFSKIILFKKLTLFNVWVISVCLESSWHYSGLLCKYSRLKHILYFFLFFLSLNLELNYSCCSENLLHYFCCFLKERLFLLFWEPSMVNYMCQLLTLNMLCPSNTC